MKSRAIFGGVLAIIVSVSSVLSIPNVGATPLEPDWFGGDPIVRKSDRTYSTSQCVNEMRQITLNSLNYYREEDRNPKNWCIYHYAGYDIAFYKRWFSSVFIDASDTLGLYPREESGMAISFDGGALRPVENVGFEFGNHLVYSSGLDKVWYTGVCRGSGCELQMYDFERSYFTLNPGMQTYVYSWRLDSTLKYDNGVSILGAGYNFSSNGKWASFIIPNVGLVRLEVATLVSRVVQTGGEYAVPSYVSAYIPLTAITDDGELILVSGRHATSVAVKYREGCSINVQPYLSGNTTGELATCQNRYFASEMAKQIPLYNGILDVTNLRIDGSGGHAWLLYANSYWYDIYPSNSLVDSGIAYLALGDSFSSGEGDVIKSGVTHYLPGTNMLGNFLEGIPRELCHVSDRSYPFLLAKDMKLTRGNNMQSIACSGAVRNDIYSDNPSSIYLGQPVLQHNGATLPRLVVAEDISGMQESALRNFIPGRVRQIELVKKYKPQVATIGISGNDLGFASILMECMTNTPGRICNFAYGEGLKSLGAAIQSNYQHQVDLYTALKQASPGTDFYAVGYPQFINHAKVSCWEIGNSLTQEERTMIHNAVSYTNRTIKHAAATAGIKYINIEDSISASGGDMCAESGMITDPAEKVFSESMTSVINRFEDGYAASEGRPLPIRLDFIQDLKNINRNYNEGVYVNAMALTMQEAFHPNARAHQAMYDYIHTRQTNDSLLNDACDGFAIICPASVNKFMPEVPESFGRTVRSEFLDMVRVDDGTGQRYIQQTGLATIERGQLMQLIADESMNNPGSMADIVIRSEPKLLGRAVIGEGGSFNAILTVPDDIPVGYHIVSIEGRSGDESIKYIQTVFITGPKGDIDGDSIANDVDTCEFINPSGNDRDSDGTDDMCDLSNSQSIHTEDIKDSRVTLNTRNSSVFRASFDSDGSLWGTGADSDRSSSTSLPALKDPVEESGAADGEGNRETLELLLLAACGLFAVMVALWMLANWRK